MEYNNKIDLIIPVYNVDKKLFIKCLSSVVQQHIIDDVLVTVVDDASTDTTSFQEVIDIFSPILNIQILRMDKNGGPGVARQYGIDHTHNEFIVFMDADDMFYNAFALERMRGAINSLDNKGNKFKMATSQFCEILVEQEDTPDVTNFWHVDEGDMVWLFGKIYRREVIEAFNIHFHPTSRANEDNGFNAQMQLCLERDEVNQFPDCTYYWNHNPNSITRRDNGKYAYDGSEDASFHGYVVNMKYAVEQTRKNNPNNIEYINLYACQVMVHLYAYYLECYDASKETVNQNLEWCKLYYKTIFKDTYPLLNEEQLMIFAESYYSSAALPRVPREQLSIPHITFWQFIDLCKEDYVNYEEEK